MRRLLILFLVLAMMLSGCTGINEDRKADEEADEKNEAVVDEDAEEKEDEIIDEAFDGEITCLYGMNLSLPKRYRESNEKAANPFNAYMFDLRNGLYMMVSYFPNEFGFSFNDFAVINKGFFLSNYMTTEQSSIKEYNNGSFDTLQFSYKKYHEDSEYSGVVTYLQVEGGIAAIDIYRTDMEFSDKEKVQVDEIIDTITLNDTALPATGSKTYPIGDKDITLSDNWQFRETQQQGSFTVKSFTYMPLSIMMNVMWKTDGSKQSLEAAEAYFASAAETENLYSTTIGGEEGYYMIHYDSKENGLYYMGTMFCTTGGIYNVLIISTEEDVSLPDEMYHRCAQLLEESVTLR